MARAAEVDADDQAVLDYALGAAWELVDIARSGTGTGAEQLAAWRARGLVLARMVEHLRAGGGGR